MRWIAAAATGTILCSPCAAQTSPSDFTSAMRYDSLRRPTGSISPDPDGSGALKYAAVRNTYDGAGNLTKVEKGELSTWQSEAVSPANWSGFTVFRTMDITYDAHLRKEKVTSSGGTAQRITQYGYDTMDRLECVAVRMNPAVFGSLPAACTPSTPGSNGTDRITRTVYDAAGRLHKRQQAYGTSAQQDYATYTHSANGMQTSVTDANGNKATMTYDGHDRQTVWTFPSKTVAGQVNTADFEQYGYDANGNRISLRKRDSSSITYTFDALNRVTAKIVPERSGLSAAQTRDVHYEYDLRGLQTKARFDSLAGEGILNEYDGFGALIATTTTMGGVTRKLDFQNDANGNRTRITHPPAIVPTHAYLGLKVFLYDYQYDKLDRPTAIINGGGKQIGGWVYNAKGELEQITRELTQPSVYAYDGLSRLTSITHDLYDTPWDLTLGFEYNPAGQVTSRSASNDAYASTGIYNVSRAYAVNGLNQYESAGPANFVYDANGNLISDGSTAFVYDVENRLVSASGAKNAALVYDPLGRLFQTSGGTSGTLQFLYDGNALVAEYDGELSRPHVYVHGIGEDVPLVWYDGGGGGRRYYTDHQGSVVAVAHPFNGYLAINGYDSWGIPNAGNKGRFQYTGQAWIPELGMYYYKARIYSPTLGRFMQTDPVGYKDQVNLYAYAGNDPVNRRDPSGLAGCASDLASSQCVDAMRLQQEANGLVANARAEIKHLREQRGDGTPGIDARAQATQTALKNAFGSSTNAVIRQIDRNLANVQRFFEDPGTAKGGKYDYRQARASEMGKYTNTALAYVDSRSPNTVALNWPILRNETHLGQVQTFIHEPLHVFGLGVPIHGEFYRGAATGLARMRGGTATALGNNPDNYACFVAPGNC